MTYLNGKKVSLRDSVIGRDKAGRPIGGHVLETNAEGEVLLSPPVQSAVWANAMECLPLDEIPEPKEDKGPSLPPASRKPEPPEDDTPPTPPEA